MAIHIRRYPRTRSSKVLCEEKFACDGELSEAVFECENCRTVQCSSCEAKLHSQTKFVHHDRKQIVPVPAERLCQLPCSEKNYAEVTCKECSMNYCAPCFDKTHLNQRKRSHHKIKFNAKTQESVASQPIPEEFATKDDFVNATLETVPAPNKHDELNSSDEHMFFSMSAMTDDKSPRELYPMMSRSPPSESKAFSELAPSIDLFAEDPSLQELNINGSNGTVSNGADLARDSAGYSSNEDSEPESLRQSSIQADDDVYSSCKSFLLADQDENIQVVDEDEFVEKLQCDRDNLVKVIAIFGNTGDGKSHTLNYTFFGGREVFTTSASPSSCTTGVWAAFDPVHNAIVIDTEGLLGVCPNTNQRTRLLLKVLAISDIVIYRSRAERLHNDLFTFLGDASSAYGKHFAEELRAAAKRNGMHLPLSTMGPVVLVFHETVHTEIIGKKTNESADDILRKRFQSIEVSVDAFSGVHYIGTQTTKPPTDFRGLLLAVKSKLNDTSVRSSRKPSVVYGALQVLNQKFIGDIEKSLPETFPDQYFTCRVQCLSCSAKCCERMNHTQDDIAHLSNSRCSFRHEYENKIFLCKACFVRGQESVVVPKTSASDDNNWFGIAKYAWSGYVLECPHCGVIFRSRQFWYGNQDPNKSVVQTEIRHVWPGSNPVLQGTHNAARRVLDGFHYVSDTLASVSAKPTKMVTNWITDQVAPTYWVPNSQISNCHNCEVELSEENKIHHCRACGKGFCDDCSTNQRKVPERGWGDMEVRVCDRCFSNQQEMTASSDSTSSDLKQVMPRKMTEVIGSTVGTLASLVNYPKDMLLDSARPQYWIPDSEISHCCVCSAAFSPKLRIHHCRCCGQGVCAPCSEQRRTVQSRGWDYPVRVCDKCNRKKQDL